MAHVLPEFPPHKNRSMDISSTLALAGSYVEAGRFGEAEKLYRQVLTLKPEEPNALYGLGCVALMAQAYEDAVRLLNAAVRKVPRAGHWHFSLGDALRYAGKLPEALRAYEKAAKLLPDNATVHNNLGAAYQETGDHKRAVQAFRRTVDLAPQDPQYLTNLGAALQKLERNAEALACFEKALAAEPNWGPAWMDKGAVFLAEGRFEEAIPALEQAGALMPDLQEPRDNLAIALGYCGRREEAIALLEESLKRNPTPLTYQTLTRALRMEYRPTEAEKQAREGINRFPNKAALYLGLALTLTEQGRIHEALAAYANAESLAQGDGDTSGGIAFCLNAIVVPPSQQKAAAEATGRALAAKPIRPGPLPPRNPERRLRIGYLSPDLRKHSVAYFLQGLLAAHDRQQVEVFCYAANATRDEMTERLNALADEWRDISRLTDDEAAHRIVQDKIDILVDLAGYTTGHRLGVLARRPAPVQITYMGYPSTTGLSAIDYRFTDALADPLGLTDAWYTERLLRLPRIFLAYAPPEAPEVNPLPGLRGQALTFGSFNAIHKLSDQTLDMWTQLLAAVPGSRLLLKTGSFSDAGVRDRFYRLFAERGIGTERLDLRGFEKETQGHLAVYHDVDIALDTFPYNGTTTTCEALYMGVPVVTLAGETHAARVGASLLHALGLEHLVATTPDAFVETASRLAGNLAELATLRQSMRQRMAGSPLMDSAGLARAIEAAYRQVWQAACRR